jgi:uroporphyrinogen-III synthase
VANNAKHPQIDLLLTRPLAGSQAFWEALDKKTRQILRPVFSPLIKIVPLASPESQVGSAIFTSAHGVENGPQGQGKTAYCVGAMTTQAAVDAGWNAVQKGETADQLVELLSNTAIDQPLTHFAGTHTRGDIARRLTSGGISTQYRAVYDQQLCPLTDAATEALSSNFPLLVPLFSPRTAGGFAHQTQGHKHLHIVALSPEVADQVSEVKVQNLSVCDRPTRAAMIDAVQMVATRVTLG